MTDYNVTRDVAGRITDRFSNMLKNLQDDYEEEIVVVSLMNYYELCSKDEYTEPEEDLLWAIERVLQDYMISKDFNDWVLKRSYPKR